MSKMETRQMVSAAASACESKKAEHIRILELDPAESGFTDYFVICSGTNERQNQAIASEIELVLKRDFGAFANSIEGFRQGDWILLDYVDFVVHIFSTEKRDFYDIERLRKTATSLGPEELKSSLAKRPGAAPKKRAMKKSARKPGHPPGENKASSKRVATKAPARKAAILKTSVAKKVPNKARKKATKAPPNK